MALQTVVRRQAGSSVVSLAFKGGARIPRRADLQKMARRRWRREQPKWTKAAGRVSTHNMYISTGEDEEGERVCVPKFSRKKKLDCFCPVGGKDGRQHAHVLYSTCTCRLGAQLC